MGFPLFVGSVPDTQIRDGHVHVTSDGVEYVVTVHVFRAFIEQGRAKLDQWERERRGDVARIGKR